MQGYQDVILDHKVYLILCGPSMRFAEALCDANPFPYTFEESKRSRFKDRNTECLRKRDKGKQHLCRCQHWHAECSVQRHLRHILAQG